MNRQVQTVGIRKWAGDHLIALQSASLQVLDGFFAEYGPCVIQGLEITKNGDNTYNVSPGLVALEAADPDGNKRIMVMPFAGFQNAALPIYLTASVETQTEAYNDGKVKPIAHDYKAVVSGVEPADTPFLTLTAQGENRFVDVIQDPAHQFISEAERTKWNAIYGLAEEYTATAVAAALRTAKEYADTLDDIVRRDYADADNEVLRNAKTYADEVVAALVDNSPEALNTLQELATALGDDPNFATTVMDAIGKRATKEELTDGLAGKYDKTGGKISGDVVLDYPDAMGGRSVVQQIGGGNNASVHFNRSVAAGRYSQVDIYTSGGDGFQRRLQVGWDFLKFLDKPVFHEGNTLLSAPRFTMAGADFNTLLTQGFYTIDDGTSPANAPIYSVAWRLLVIGNVDHRLNQIAMPWSSDSMFFRRKSNAEWSAWREIYHNGNLKRDLWARIDSSGYITAQGPYNWIQSVERSVGSASPLTFIIRTSVNVNHRSFVASIQSELTYPNDGSIGNNVGGNNNRTLTARVFFADNNPRGVHVRVLEE